MDDDLGVHGRLEDAAALNQLAPHFERVGQIAVVGDGETATGQVCEDRLHVAQHGIALCGIAVVPDSAVALELGYHGRIGKNVADMPHAAVGVEDAAIVANDAGGFLAAVLQGM